MLSCSIVKDLHGHRGLIPTAAESQTILQTRTNKRHRGRLICFLLVKVQRYLLLSTRGWPGRKIFPLGKGSPSLWRSWVDRVAWLAPTPGNSARLRGDIGSTLREHWLQCAKAARCQPPDMGISTCVLNAGFAIAAVPPHILPTTSSSLKSTHADPRQSIGSDIYLKTMKPGTIVSGSSHHVTYEQVRAFTAIDRNPEGSLAREMAYCTKQLCGATKQVKEESGYGNYPGEA